MATASTNETPHLAAERPGRFPPAWTIVAAGATVPIGVSAAAAVTSSMSISERVALAAWVVVGVVGTASVVSAAAILRGRRPRRQREHVVEKTGNGRKRETTTR